MNTSVTIDQVGMHIQLNGEPVKLVIAGPGYAVVGKCQYPVSVDITVGGAKFCLEQGFDEDHTTLYEYETNERAGYYKIIDSIMVPGDHAIVQWLKPITA